MELVDALRVTWPRDAASPDGVHYLRHRFRLPLDDPVDNRKGESVRAGLGFTAPPPLSAAKERASDRAGGGECIGDAGWEVALQLHAQLVASLQVASQDITVHRSLL